MKIISKFNDYYDSLVYAYGEDPKIVYVRKEKYIEPEFTYHHPLRMDSDIRLGFREQWFKNDVRENIKYCVGYLIVAGNVFPVAMKKQSDVWEKKIVMTKDELFDFHPLGLKTWYSDLYAKCIITGKQKWAVDLCIQMQTPILFMSDYRDSRVRINDGQIALRIHTNTKLADWGLPRVYPAEQAYQDISSFLLNDINGSPDRDPPKEVNNEEKILAHGFDLKTSFRHR